MAETNKIVLLPDIVEERIRRYIVRHNLRPGDALPKEIQFVKLFGVTRNVVREALSRLRMFGLIESKKRRGMILAHPDILVGFERLARLDVLDKRTETGLFDLRLVLELGLTDLICLRKTKNDINELRQIVRNQQQVKANSAEWDNLDIAFHRRLYRIAGNVLIDRLLDIINTFFRICRRRGVWNIKEGKPSPSHRDLLNALEQNDVRRFRENMRRHLDRYIKYICQAETSGPAKASRGTKRIRKTR